MAQPPVKTAPPPEASFIDNMSGGALLLTGLGGVLLLGLGIYGIYSSGRKKQNQQHFEDSILSDSSLKANSLFGSTGGQNVDTTNSVFNSNFAPSASKLDTNEVDPVAEADVYIAYGRDAQAEEILKEALRTQPDRNAVRVKLLEIYATRKDQRAFEIMATELYGLTKGEGDDWVQAAALGATLDPNNPLYTAGRSDDELTAKTVMSDPTDELDLEALLASTESGAPVEISKPAAPSYLAEAPKVPEVKAPEPIAKKVDAGGPLDFDLDGFSVPNAKAQAPNLKKVDDDFDQRTVAVPSTKRDESLHIDVPSLKQAPDTSLDFDLSGISLDLKQEEAATKSDYSNAATDNPEMATKLDLAIAYQEIGDKEGARELLDEVVKGGSVEQSTKARTMLAKLA